MSVELLDITKIVYVDRKPLNLFSGLSLRVGPGQRIGVLGLPKTGKSTLLRLLCGTEKFSSGAVGRTSTVSWPIPMSDYLTAHTTIAANIRFVARMLGLESDNLVREIARMGDLTDVLNRRLQDCPPAVRQQLAFILGLAFDFDIYLFDDRIIPGRAEFKERAVELFKERTAGRGLVVAAGGAWEVEAHCDTVFVLEDGRAKHFADKKEGVAYFKSTMQSAANKPKATEMQPSAPGLARALTLEEAVEGEIGL